MTREKGEMIIVTGAARTGTSLMVRIIAGLGVAPVAKPFLREHRGKHDFNPDGFYDSTFRDILSSRPRRGCMKVWGGGLKFMPEGTIERIIVCTRARGQAIESHARWLRRCHWPFPKTVARWLHDVHMTAAVLYYPTTGVPIAEASLEWVKSSPVEAVTQIARFIGAAVDGATITATAAMVRS